MNILQCLLLALFTNPPEPIIVRGRSSLNQLCCAPSHPDLQLNTAQIARMLRQYQQIPTSSPVSERSVDSRRPRIRFIFYW